MSRHEIVLAISVMVGGAFRVGTTGPPGKRLMIGSMQNMRAVSDLRADALALNCSHFAACSGCVVDKDFVATPIALRARSRLEPILGRQLEFKVGEVRGWCALA